MGIGLLDGGGDISGKTELVDVFAMVDICDVAEVTGGEVDVAPIPGCTDGDSTKDADSITAALEVTCIKLDCSMFIVAISGTKRHVVCT